MEVVLAEHAGFCFGVKRAVDTVLESLESGKKIYTYGPIVHNESVVNELSEKGVNVLENEEDLLKLIDCGTSEKEKSAEASASDNGTKKTARKKYKTRKRFITNDLRGNSSYLYYSGNRLMFQGGRQAGETPFAGFPSMKKCDIINSIYCISMGGGCGWTDIHVRQQSVIRKTFPIRSGADYLILRTGYAGKREEPISDWDRLRCAVLMMKPATP